MVDLERGMQRYREKGHGVAEMMMMMLMGSLGPN